MPQMMMYPQSMQQQAEEPPKLASSAPESEKRAERERREEEERKAKLAFAPRYEPPPLDVVLGREFEVRPIVVPDVGIPSMFEGPDAVSPFNPNVPQTQDADASGTRVWKSSPPNGLS